MKLSEKGWLSAYIDYRKNHFGESQLASSEHPDYALYKLLQPTGMLYGSPVQPENLDPAEFAVLTEHDRLKVLLAESLINAALLLDLKEISNSEAFSHKLDITVENITNFYNQIYPEIAVSNRTLFGGKKNPADVAEKIIERRIAKMPASDDGFWSHFFYNTLVFLDIYFFGQWIHTSLESSVSQFFIQEKEDLRFTVIKVMVAAAHANDIIEIEEKKLFEHLLNSAQLSSSREKEAWNYLEHGISVEEIPPPENNSWLLKKYFLELAILTVWADRVVDEREIIFLKRLNKHLGFFEDDLDKSMMAIEGFVLDHWKELGELQSKKSFDELGQEYEEKIAKIAQRSETRITQEIKESEQITRLITKYRSGTISKEDEERLKNLLMQTLQKLPTFAFVALPSTYLTLPLLFKILPEAVLNR